MLIADSLFGLTVLFQNVLTGSKSCQFHISSKTTQANFLNHAQNIKLEQQLSVSRTDKTI